MTLENIASALPGNGQSSPPDRVRRVSLAMPSKALCLVGATYSLANGRGERIAMVSVVPQGLGATRTAAARMAYSSEMAGVMRAASLDYELSGTVSSETVSLMRRLLEDIGAS